MLLRPRSPMDTTHRHFNIRYARLLPQVISLPCDRSILLHLLLHLIHNLLSLLRYGYLPTPLRIRPQSRQKFAHSRLILFVLWILVRGDQLRKPRACLEQDEVRDRAYHRPVKRAIRGVATPLVQRQPEGLFGGEIGMAAP